MSEIRIAEGSLEILVGQIGAGKSTYCKSAAKQGAIIVNDDALVLALHGGDYSLYDEELKPLYKSTEHHIIQTGLSLGRRVLVDRPCHRRSTRLRYAGIAESLDCIVTYVCFRRLPWGEAAQRRFDKNNRGLSLFEWQKIAEDHEKRFEKVLDHEPYDYILFYPEDFST